MHELARRHSQSRKIAELERKVGQLTMGVDLPWAAPKERAVVFVRPPTALDILPTGGYKEVNSAQRLPQDPIEKMAFPGIACS